MIIENPKIKDADKFKKEVFLLSRVKGSPYFKGKKAKSIMELKFREVETIKDYFLDLTDENLLHLFEMFYNETKINDVRCLEFYRAFNYIKESIQEVYEKEKLLMPEPNEKLINAGIDEMNIFGSLNITKEIGMQFGKFPHEVEELDYGYVFTLALSNKRQADIQKRLNK